MKLWCQNNGYAHTVSGQDQTDIDVVKMHNRYLGFSRKAASASILGTIESLENLDIKEG